MEVHLVYAYPTDSSGLTHRYCDLREVALDLTFSRREALLASVWSVVKSLISDCKTRPAGVRLLMAMDMTQET